MKKIQEIVQKIERPYVGDDCIQVMVPYSNTITLLNEDGILYHRKPGSDLYINRYLEDERRKEFPYWNIPVHQERKSLFKKMTYTNQLLNFDKPYLRISDGLFIESYAVKDNNEALLINSLLQPRERVEHMTYEELLAFIANHNPEEQVYYVYVDGSITESDKILPSKERIYEFIKKEIIKDINSFNNFERLRYSWLLEFAAQNIDNLDLSLIDFNLILEQASALLIIRVNKGKISLEGINTTFVKDNDFKVTIYDIPVNRYTLEQLKNMPKRYITKEPKIPLRLNPGVSKQDIKEARQMVRTLKI